MKSKVFMNKRTKGMLVVLALFVCTSFCLGQTITVNKRIFDEYYKHTNIAGNGDTENYGKVPDDNCWKNPIGRTLIIEADAEVCNAYGAYMNAYRVDDKSDKCKDFRLMKNNKIIVNGGKFDNSNIAGALVGKYKFDTIDDVVAATVLVDIASNTVIIKGGSDIKNVYGGYTKTGTVSSNTVTINSDVTITIGHDVCGGYIVEDGTATLNTVTIISGTVKHNVYGARIGNQDFMKRCAHSDIVELASSNTVTIISGTVKHNVYGAFIGKGLASSNTVTIDGGIIGEKDGNIYCGCIHWNGTATLNTVNLTDVDVTCDVYGALINESGLASSNTVTIISGTVKHNVYGAFIGRGLASSNTVIITSGIVGDDVYGGYIFTNGTATLNTVNLTSVTVWGDVYGAKIGKNGYASNNIVTMTGGRVEGDVLGGRIMVGTGTSTGNTVKLTDVDVKSDVYGARIGISKEEIAKAKAKGTKVIEAAKEAGRAEDNVEAKRKKIDKAFVDELHKITEMVVVIATYRYETDEAQKAKTEEILVSKMEPIYTAYEAGKHEFKKDQDKRVKAFKPTAESKAKAEYAEFLERLSSGYAEFSKSFLGRFVEELQAYGDKAETYGLASSNTVTIDSGKIEGNVYGGYVGGNGKAINNTINISGNPVFSTGTILCGGICANASTNDAFTGNTLDIRTKGVVVKGISNFEGYKFTLNKNVKPGDTMLKATSGGCSWDVGREGYTRACAVDLSSSNITLYVEDIIDEGACYTLIKSPEVGFKNGAYKRFDFKDNRVLVKYKWKLELTSDGQDLKVTLTEKEASEEKTKPLLEGYGAGIACINNGMDCVLSKMEESGSLVGGDEGEIGAFYGIAANKSRYNTGSHVDMVGMSMMVGAGKVVEVGGKELTVGAFAEYGTGDSDIHCEKKSKGTSKYVGGGALGRYNLRGDENSRAKMYAEVVLRVGKVNNSFKGNEVKNEITGEEPKYEVEPMYEGAEAGIGYKRKVSEKIDLDWSLKYVFGCQNKKDVTLPDDGNIVKFESVISNRIRAGVRGNCTGIGKVKPYAGMWYERELSGKVKAIVRDGRDDINVAKSPSFEGGILMIEAGVSSKVWKFDVDISGQGYAGVRKGIGGMLKIKYAFGKSKNAYTKH